MDLNLKRQPMPLQLPRLTLSSGSLEALKWLGLISMTIDHGNRFFLNGQSEIAYCCGRLAFPLFAFVFVYHFARLDLNADAVYLRVMKRLFFFGLIAMPGYMAMKQLVYPWPLNILFTFFIAIILFSILGKKSLLNIILIILVFLIGGLLVEYSWTGIFFCLATWSFCKRASLFSIFLYCFAYLLLNDLNGNAWALLSLPCIFLAAQVNFPIRRIPHLFYYYYPAHLTVFWVLQRYVKLVS